MGSQLDADHLHGKSPPPPAGGEGGLRKTSEAGRKRSLVLAAESENEKCKWREREGVRCQNSTAAALLIPPGLSLFAYYVPPSASVLSAAERGFPARFLAIPPAGPPPSACYVSRSAISRTWL
ncbi:Hypothetical protein NTJ_03143 [Nesidiocoris tenuis]|uniref:Uncharacterized protein n=1 Tax=Nesidiocoris tenuis TaxID=355587 RepID=A0ABN7ADH7_9HEMI|nr:Hypothetical protein NTJ_03143 [Nesidiocoris tenuis]